MTDLWTYEAEARAAGYSLICGVDEAGAGPLMGPVYAAVPGDPNARIEYLEDAFQ